MASEKLGATVLDRAGGTLPFSEGLRIGDTVYLSGQLSIDGQKIVGQSITEQTDFIFDHVEALLGEAEMELADIVKVTVWLSNASDFQGFNTAYAARLSPPFPTRVTTVATLLVAGALIEMDVIAIGN